MKTYHVRIFQTCYNLIVLILLFIYNKEIQGFMDLKLTDLRVRDLYQSLVILFSVIYVNCYRTQEERKAA